MSEKKETIKMYKVYVYIHVYINIDVFKESVCWHTRVHTSHPLANKTSVHFEEIVEYIANKVLRKV